MSRPEALAFYLLVPVCIGLLLGWGHVGQVAGQLPHYQSLLYWVGLAVLIWTLNDPATRFVSFVLAPALKQLYQTDYVHILGQEGALVFRYSNATTMSMGDADKLLPTLDAAARALEEAAQRFPAGAAG